MSAVEGRGPPASHEALLPREPHESMPPREPFDATSFGGAATDGDRVRVELDAALELLPEPACVVDAERRLAAANAAFRRLLRTGGALALRDGALSAVHAGVAARLEDRVRAVARGGAARVLYVPTTAAGEALELRLAPFRAAHVRALVAIVVHDPVRTRAVCVARLRELYEFTRAEAEVAARLAEGCSLEGAAERLGVSLNTVRTHVRHLFAKCGVGTQAALLQRLALGAARIGDVWSRDADPAETADAPAC